MYPKNLSIHYYYSGFTFFSQNKGPA